MNEQRQTWHTCLAGLYLLRPGFCALQNINPFAALGRLTDQNIDKHLSSYAKSGIDLIIMERQP